MTTSRPLNSHSPSTFDQFLDQFDKPGKSAEAMAFFDAALQKHTGFNDADFAALGEAEIATLRLGFLSDVFEQMFLTTPEPLFIAIPAFLAREIKQAMVTRALAHADAKRN